MATAKKRIPRRLRGRHTHTKKQMKGGVKEYILYTDPEYLEDFVKCYIKSTATIMVNPPKSCRIIERAGATYRSTRDVKNNLLFGLTKDIIEYLSEVKNRSSLYFKNYSGLINTFLKNYEIYTYEIRVSKGSNPQYSQELIKDRTLFNSEEEYNYYYKSTNYYKSAKLVEEENKEEYKPILVGQTISVNKPAKLYITKEIYDKLFFVISEVLKLYSYKINTFIPKISMYISKQMGAPLDENKECDCNTNYYYWFYILFNESGVDPSNMPTVVNDSYPTDENVTPTVLDDIEPMEQVQNILLMHVVLDIVASLSLPENRPYYYKNYSGILKSISNKYIVQFDGTNYEIIKDRKIVGTVSLPTNINLRRPTNTYGYSQLTEENKKNLVNMIMEILKMYEDDNTGKDQEKKTQKQKNIVFLNEIYTISQNKKNENEINDIKDEIKNIEDSKKYINNLLGYIKLKESLGEEQAGLDKIRKSLDEEQNRLTREQNNLFKKFNKKPEMSNSTSGGSITGGDVKLTDIDYNKEQNLINKDIDALKIKQTDLAAQQKALTDKQNPLNDQIQRTINKLVNKGIYENDTNGLNNKLESLTQEVSNMNNQIQKIKDGCKNKCIKNIFYHYANIFDHAKYTNNLKDQKRPTLVRNAVPSFEYLKPVIKDVNPIENKEENKVENNYNKYEEEDDTNVKKFKDEDEVDEEDEDDKTVRLFTERPSHLVDFSGSTNVSSGLEKNTVVRPENTENDIQTNLVDFSGSRDTLDLDEENPFRSEITENDRPSNLVNFSGSRDTPDLGNNIIEDNIIENYALPSVNTSPRPQQNIQQPPSTSAISPAQPTKKRGFFGLGFMGLGGGHGIHTKKYHGKSHRKLKTKKRHGKSHRKRQTKKH